MTTIDHAGEIVKCTQQPAYFIERYCRIYDAVLGDWIPFTLWAAQRQTLDTIHANQLTVALKARQLGLTWLVLCYALWLMLFRATAVCLLFSRRDTEARYLLSGERLRGVYKRLPDWMRTGHGTLVDSAGTWTLENESTARSFPTTAGDSYTATLAIVDEADLAPDLNKLMRAVKPTIDNGGKMVLVSRSDKTKPISEFKRIYRGAKMGSNEWAHVFLPWHVHPKRDAAWYAAQKADILARTGATDDLHEQYPATDTEALAPRSLDKRIPAQWLEAVYAERDGANPLGIPGCVVYVEPGPGREYVIGADPAEGNPNSDDSAATVLDKETGEECATIAGKFQPEVLGGYVAQLSRHYNDAPAMVERNNHGHTVLLWLKDNSPVRRLTGMDKRPGWLSSTKGKVMLYDSITEAVRNGEVLVHSFETIVQLGSIEASTLRAPDGQHDDRADAIALAWRGVLKPVVQNAIPASGGKRTFR